MGRPKGSTAQRIWADALRKTALERVKEHGNARKLDLAAKAAWDRAMAGDPTVLKEMGDRIDGKVPQALIGGQKGEPPIAFQLVELCPVYPRETED